MAEVAARSRAAALANPYAQLSGSVTAADLLGRAVRGRPAARARLPADHRRRRGGGARRRRRAPASCASGPAWIRGIDHRIERTRSACATSPTVAVDALAAGRAGGRGGPVDVAELHAPFTHQELILREALGLGDDVAVNPSGGALCRQPDDGRRARPHRRGGAARSSTAGPTARVGPRDQRPVPAAEPGRASWREA